jgi:hypothetical protein
VADRWDETWHRLRDWTQGQGPSERLAAQILISDGFGGVDPSHPLGGPDGGKDALCSKDGAAWAMAVYFARGAKRFRTIKDKFVDDLRGVKKNKASGIVFVTNQELRLDEREALKKICRAKRVGLHLYHLERVTTILDSPAMAPVRKQFLRVGEDGPVLEAVAGVAAQQKHLAALQTGGEAFCGWSLYQFDLSANCAMWCCIRKHGTYPLFGLHVRIIDMDADITRPIMTRDFAELNAPAVFFGPPWPLRPSVYYRGFFQARNGSWHQDLILRRSEAAQCWLAAERVVGQDGRVLREAEDKEFAGEFGEPRWRP